MRAEKMMAAIGGARRILGIFLVASAVFSAALLGAQNAAQQATLMRLAGRNLQPNQSGGLSAGVEASNYSLRRPGALAFDATGDLYVADTGNHRILRIDLTGVVFVVAGTGEQGFGGDSGEATSALLDSPAGVAVDRAGNLYIADTHNQRIRKVSGGILTTIAGTGVAGYSGDGLTATASMLNGPTAVAVDASDNVYLADTNNHRIRMISGDLLVTVAGSGDQGYLGDGGQATSAWLDSPNGIAVDAALNLYISDTHNQRIRMVAHATGLISTVAGDGSKGYNGNGTATSFSLARPLGLALDSAGNLVIADSDNQRIRTLSSGQLATVAGSGQQGFGGDTGHAVDAQLDSPRAVALFQGSVTVADTGNNAIRSVANGGANTTGGTPANAGETLVLSGPTTAAYGAGSLTATFTNGSNTATGAIAFYDGLGSAPQLLGSVALAANQAVFSTTALNAGTHFITASYAGDANNPALVSRTYVLTLTPVALTAVADAASMHYGETLPAFTGSLPGVLAQDAGKVAAVFSTTATSTTSPGVYAITAALSGSAAGNYTVAMGTGSGSLTIATASSFTTLATSHATPVYGEMVTLTAAVTSDTSGTPTGTVLFYRASELLSATPATLVNGVATLALNTLPIGSSSLHAVSSGDINFNASTSSDLSETVSAPVLVSAPSTLPFGSQQLGATSELQTVIVSNPYGLPVTVSSVTASDDYATSSHCPTIAAYGTCSIGVTFTPTAQGERNGTLTVAIAQSTTVLNVALTGTGTAAGILITPARIDFGSQVIATASYGQTLSIQNTGNADLVLSNVALTGDYASTGSCATVHAGSRCELTVTFKPTATGTRTGTLTLTDNVGAAAQTQAVNLTGVGTQAGATLSPARQSFPNTLVGSSSMALRVTLANTGTAPLTGISAALQGDFSQTSTCGATLAAAASCTFSVVFAPTLNGAETGTLTVTDNLGTQSAALSGSGTAPGAALNTAQILFGSQLISTTSLAQTVIFTNTGTAPATIASVALTGQFTDTTNCAGQIAAGDSCSVNVLFAPVSAGQQSGTLTISSNVGSGTQSVSLLGQGIAPGLAIAPSFATFGSQVVGTASLAQTLVATNTGTAPLTLAAATVSNNFTETDQCAGATLQPGATCSISLSFAPTATGSLQGSLVLGDATGTVAAMVTLTGQGTLPGVANSPSNLSFGSLPVGVPSRAQTVTVTNTGTAPLTIGTVASTGDFDATDNCAGQTLAAGAYCVISVTLTPSTIGTRTGQIQFTNNADGLHIIALSGVGQQAGVEISPTSLAFGSIPLGSSSNPLSVTVSNSGTATLLLSNIVASSDFSASDNCGGAVAVGHACTIAVTFKPTALAHRTGTLTLFDNAAGGGTQVVSLEGFGSPAGLILSPSVLNFGVQRIGSASNVQFATLTNQTGHTLTALTITASGEYYVASTCTATLLNGASCNLRIWVIPIFRGAVTGTITITYTAASSGSMPDRPHAMDLSGDGSGMGVVSLLTTGNDAPNPPAQLVFTTSPAATVVAGGHAGAFVTVQENDSDSNPTNATDSIALAVTGPGGYSRSYTATASGGLAVFDLSGAPLTVAGSYSYTASLSGLTPASASESVVAAAPATITAPAGSGQSAVILTAFATPLQILAKDAYGNLVSGAIVQFTAPGSGASATFLSNPVTTNSSGLASTSASANGTVGSFSVAASSGVATTASFTLTNTQGTPILTWPNPAAIAYGTPLSATQLNATANVPGSFVYAPAAGAVLTVGNQTISTTFTATDTTDYTSATANVTLTVNAAQPTVALTATPNPVFIQNAVTYTATVTGTATTPAGTVTFLDGATTLGAATLNGAGVATLQAALATSGAHSVTAVYSATTLYKTATSNAITALAQDFSLNAGGAATVSILPGQTATYTFSVAPVNGSTLPAAIALAASGAPSGATVTVSPATIAAGSGATTVTLTIVPASDQIVQQPPRTPGRRAWPLSLAVLLLPLAGLRRSRRIFGVLVLLLAGWCATTGLAGCTKASGYFGQTPKSFTVSVTGTSGALSHTANVTLTVQ